MSEHNVSISAATVGRSFVLRKEAVTTRQLVMYAGASGDYNRIHYDQPFAIEAGLGGVIAHGMLTMGFAAQCVTDWVGPSGFTREVSGRFVKPVRPGDEVEISGEVAGREDSENGSLVAIALSGSVGEKKVFIGAAKVAFPATA